MIRQQSSRLSAIVLVNKLVTRQYCQSQSISMVHAGCRVSSLSRWERSAFDA